jgi:hypothetical protein
MNKRMIGTVVGGLAVAAALATARISLARNNDADGDRAEGFSNRSIEGDYGFVATPGLLLAPGGAKPLPMAGIGRIHFDGQGGCKVTSVTNIDGQASSFHSSSCRYTVHPDGTGTSEAVFPDSPIAEPLPVAFVITERGRELMVTNTRFIVSAFVAHRQ